MLLEVGRKQILFGDGNDSLGEGRLNDVEVKGDNCQRNVLEQTRANFRRLLIVKRRVDRVSEYR